MKKWKKVKTKKIYKFGKYYRVEVDQVITPGGADGEYSVVKSNPHSIIIPIDNEGMIYFVKQHRYTTDQITIELPMGSTDGEDPLIAAKRELEEEMGLISDDWGDIGRIYVANGIADKIGYIFVARDVRFIENPIIDPLDKDLIEIVKYALGDVKKMIIDGIIDDADTISAIAKNFLL